MANFRRKRSPTKLSDKTVRNKTNAGMKDMCGSVFISANPSAIIPPQVGAGGGMPTPKNDKEPSIIMIIDMKERM